LANLFTLMFSATILVMKIRYEAVPKLQAQRQLYSAAATTQFDSGFPGEWQLETEMTFSSPEPESSSPAL